MGNKNGVCKACRKKREAALARRCPCGARLRPVNRTGWCQHCVATVKCTVCKKVIGRRGVCDECKARLGPGQKIVGHHGGMLKVLPAGEQAAREARIAKYEKMADLKIPLQHAGRYTDAALERMLATTGGA